MKSSTIILATSILCSLAYASDVKSIESNGYVSGVQSWAVNCTSGARHIIYKKNGTWYDGMIGHMGHKFDSWSKEEVAKYECNN